MRAQEKCAHYYLAQIARACSSQLVETSSSSSFIPSELTKAGNANVKIIAKLERPLALENLEEIIEESDAIR